MIELARRADRVDLFRAVAQKRGLHEAIIEKDFWVCWLLDYLFTDSPWKDRLAFKGGTSLSKAYCLIQRFSEDIDLILDWTLLGFDPDEPWDERSTTKQDLFNKGANEKTKSFLESTFLPSLRRDLEARLAGVIDLGLSGQEVLFTYPRSFKLEAIQPQIRLEIGPLAAWVPNEERPIRPYVADDFPLLFSRPSVQVRTVSAQRTFWEKATILHQEAHRSNDKAVPLRYSRHYYDMNRMIGTDVELMALADLDLLEAVVTFKQRFYRSSWARYEDARPGSFRLLPSEGHRRALELDYQSMRSMIFGPIPPFAEVIDSLARTEQSINGIL